ncbi:MAG TPA: mechanosensitive ion channel family protein [Hellea balneolensis]|uniref:Small-conductance mechanosensitive channel n=1 Tax=Hellea balneolensis TaxID=287478 RepID=A0A7V5NX43_9PROT|nr:mechanosensitive ion channel family protein [Hellea balneolensis]
MGFWGEFWSEQGKRIKAADLLGVGEHMLMAVGVLIIGWILAKWADRMVRARLGNNKGLKADETFRPLIATFVRYAVLFAALYTAFTVAGIPSSSLLAAFGAAGLAIALAIQGTLANVASGLMLIFLRALKVGDYIETPDVEGTVLEIGLFTTGIKTSDGIFITVPNSAIWSKQIKNYSRYRARRIDIDLEVGRDNNLETILERLQNVLLEHEKVINTSSAAVVIAGFTPGAVKLKARCWLKADNLWGDASEVRLALHEALQKMNVEWPPVVTGQPG